jgi:integration host factor subunit beta
MRTITKKELTDRIADRVDSKRVLVKDIIQRFLDEVITELTKGNRLEFRDFGVFEVRMRKPRMAQNPRTMQRVPVREKRTVKFKVGRLMRDRVEGGQPDAQAPRASRPVQAPTVSQVPPSPSAE